MDLGVMAQLEAVAGDVDAVTVAEARQGYFKSGVGDAPPPAVVSRGQRVGELADLRRIPAVSLSEIHYYNIEQAKLKYGMQYTGGVIELTYKQQQ